MDEQPMPRATRELTPRVHAAACAGVGDLAPSTMRIPNAHYTDPAILEAELRTSFTAPLLLTAGKDVANAGDFVTMDLMGTPVVIVRGTDGRARVLLNACRHRGAQIAEGSGCTRRFTCGYHNWVYDAEGSLVGIPGREGFDDIDMGDHGLVELPSEERHGFIWALRDPAGVLDVDRHLGPLDDELASWGFEYDVAAKLELELQSNWKCALEAFMETYHFPYVHGSSMVGLATVANVVTFDQIGRHHRLGVPLFSMGTGPEPAAGENLVVIYYIHPCTVIATSMIGGEMLQFYPGKTPSSSTIRYTVLSRADLDQPGMTEFYADFAPRMQSVIRDEDAPMLERSGIGLAAGLSDVVLGRNEIGCQAAHRQILADLAGDVGSTVPAEPVAIRAAG